MRPTLTSKSDRSGNDLSQRVGAGADGLKGLTRKSLREKTCALVAQLDRASDFESEGRAFESLRERHFGIRYRDQMPPICRSGRQAVSAEPGSHHLGDTRRRARVECTVTVILVLDVPIPIIHQKRIAELAATYRLPTMFLGGRRMSEAGGLIAYGTGLLDTLPRIPVYVEKILGGAKPGDLPIEVLTQHILIFNLKTARTIGVTIPPELLKRADQVIE